MANVLTALILAFWVSAIALLSVQNAKPIALNFFSFQSVEIPVGLVLAFSAALGMVGTSIIFPIRASRSRSLNDR